MSLGSVLEINKLVGKGMSNIHWNIFIKKSSAHKTSILKV